MTNKLTINVSGGSFSLGNATQGNENNISGVLNSTQATEILGEASERVLAMGGDLKLPEDQLQTLRTALAELQNELKKPNPSTTSATGAFKTIRDNFSWAYPLIKDSIAVAWPALLAAITA